MYVHILSKKYIARKKHYFPSIHVDIFYRRFDLSLINTMFFLSSKSIFLLVNGLDFANHFREKKNY